MQLVKQRGKIYAPVYLNYGTPECRFYYVDVSASNPGPMFIGGEQVGETVAEAYAREQRGGHFKIEDTDGHVRMFNSDGYTLTYIGMWCPYSKAIEASGPVFGHEGLAHHARMGSAWCPATQDKVEVQ